MIVNFNPKKLGLENVPETFKSPMPLKREGKMFISEMSFEQLIETYKASVEMQNEIESIEGYVLECGDDFHGGENVLNVIERKYNPNIIENLNIDDSKKHMSNSKGGIERNKIRHRAIGTPQVARAIRGNSKPFNVTIRQQEELNIGICAAFPSWTKGCEIEEFFLTCAKKLYNLENKGYRLNVHILFATEYDDYKFIVNIKIPNYTASEYSAVLSHVGLYRQLKFSTTWTFGYLLMGDNKHARKVGYGRSYDYSDIFTRYNFDYFWSN